MMLLLGSDVMFHFTTFFAIHPMPASKLVRVAASLIVFMSLLSDISVLRTSIKGVFGFSNETY